LAREETRRCCGKTGDEGIYPTVQNEKAGDRKEKVATKWNPDIQNVMSLRIGFC